MNILLADDSKTMRNIQKKAIAALGDINFVEAADGIEALSAVAAYPGGFAILLVDWNMPNMDGLTFVARFREKDKKTPILMVTTEAEKQRIIDAVRAGASNYMLKPFTPEALIEKVKATLAKAQATAA